MGFGRCGTLEEKASVVKCGKFKLLGNYRRLQVAEELWWKAGDIRTEQLSLMI